jgi:hypothetical protein
VRPEVNEFDFRVIKLTRVAKMKMRADGITSGMFSLPVCLHLRTIVLTDWAKSITAIPDITNSMCVQLGNTRAHHSKNL